MTYTVADLLDHAALSTAALISSRAAASGMRVSQGWVVVCEPMV